ncbi:hypothetical protein BVDSYZ_21710 (plasmid) [Bacillus velezensis]|uniref:Uncharacterized protein n=1 Tax=Bacillus velezensis TaxID=492670 RepID=A0ABC8DFL6_BACVE|nr:hypothetical protein BVDSYZ_21710 [Bacillus velezensis]
MPWPPVRSSGSCRAPSAAVLRCRCRITQGCRTPIAHVALAVLPDLATLLQLQFFTAGAAIAQGCRTPIAHVALAVLPDLATLLQLQFFAAGAESPRHADAVRLRCPGRLTGLPDLTALLQIQFFTAGTV